MKKQIILGTVLIAMLTIFGCGEKKDITKDEQWPQNEFTELVDKPEFGELNGAVEIEEEFFVSINDTELDDVKSYVEKVQENGFTENQEIIDKEAIGIEVYNYSAENPEGYEISIEYSVSICSITISK